MKQVKIYVGDEEYRKLSTLANVQKITVPKLVKKLVLEYLNEVDGGDPIREIRELRAKYEQILRELGRVEKDIAFLLKRCNKT